MIEDYTDSYLRGTLNIELEERKYEIEQLKKKSENIEKRMKKKVAKQKQDLRRWF